MQLFGCSAWRITLQSAPLLSDRLCQFTLQTVLFIHEAKFKHHQIAAINSDVGIDF
jgi:hypothetical protein